VGRRSVVIMVGAPITGTFAMVSPTSHHGRRSKASFKIGGGERQFPSQLTEDQKSKVSSLTPHCLYHRGKLKHPFGTHAWDNARCPRCFRFFAIQTAQRPTHCEWGSNPHVNNVDPPGVVRQQGRWATNSCGVCGPCSSTK
jgi:hypothetical protein